MAAEHTSGRAPHLPPWVRALARFQASSTRRAVGQLLDTMPLLLGVLLVMGLTVRQGAPYALTLVLAVLAAGLLVRSFIFLHDCCHAAFFPSRRANAVLGFLIGVLTLVPYAQWRWSHLAHHGAFANLDKRGLGDVWVMTVDEYRAATPWQRLVYCVYRHPLVLFGLGPALLFGIIYRFPIRGAPAQARRSVWFTDLAIAGVFTAATFTVGLQPFLLVMAPVWILAWSVGVWLFYVQHQFPGVYWARQGTWDFLPAALHGASYYRLPPVLQWFTGSIGLHHLHHLRARIPNYRLQEAYDATPEVQAVPPLTLRGSLACLGLRLYDEAQGALVTIKSL